MFVKTEEAVIVTAGKNNQPQDIEKIVSSHPAVHDGRAVAFGLPSRRSPATDQAARAIPSHFYSCAIPH
jgi:acyl-CoA synthetase (AMP-forming)/AMP-acid ligase II